MIKVWRALRLSMLGLGFLFVAVTLLPIDNYWIGALAGPWNDPAGDILIVLGGDSLADTLGHASYLRSVYAARIWRQGGFHLLVISGGSSNGGAPVAEQMRDFIVFQGVPAGSIAIENQSRDTHENAVLTTKLLAAIPGRRVLLTSDAHMFRAWRAFRKAGMDVAPRPFPDAGKRVQRWELRWPLFIDLCVETAKSGYYFIRGWI